jgi:hypothetical protein
MENIRKGSEADSSVNCGSQWQSSSPNHPSEGFGGLLTLQMCQTHPNNDIDDKSVSRSSTDLFWYRGRKPNSMIAIYLRLRKTNIAGPFGLGNGNGDANRQNHLD